MNTNMRVFSIFYFLHVETTDKVASFIALLSSSSKEAISEDLDVSYFATGYGVHYSGIAIRDIERGGGNG